MCGYDQGTFPHGNEMAVSESKDSISSSAQELVHSTYKLPTADEPGSYTEWQSRAWVQIPL